MKRAVVVLIVAMVVSTFVGIHAGAKSPVAVTPVSRVWTEPQVGFSFLRNAIHQAKRSIDISIYELSDSITVNDLIVKAKGGVLVRVLLNSAYESKTYNAPAAALLKAGSVQVAWAPSGQIFHAKYVLVDDQAVYVGTGNLVAGYYSSTRDFWVEVTSHADVAAISSTFYADFSHNYVAPRNASGLVWSPGSTSALVSLINAAKTSLLVENEEMKNTSIERALMSAARRGVHVEVVMTYSAQWSAALTKLEGAGVKVATLGPTQVYVHAKVICSDCTATSGTAFIGSENFSISSLVYNRELGVITKSLVAVRALESTINADFALGQA